VGSTVSPIPIHDHQAAASPLSLRSPRVPISAHTKKFDDHCKKENHTRIQTQARKGKLE